MSHGASSVKRAFKYRFYPTGEQACELRRTFGCVRKVYNLALTARTEAWTRQERVTYEQTSAMLTRWKRTEDLAYLSEVSSVPLQQALRHLQAAVGIDAGLTALVTLSSGEKITNPKYERKDRGRLARAQRELSRKEKGSANRAKARTRVAKVHARIADRRRDFLHRLTTRLVRENQTLVIEDLSVRAMVKNHRLARAISDAAWNELRSMLEYKTAWYGRELITVDRWFPSSKLCSAGGAIAGAMSLNVRDWTCVNCGAFHDRDVNAAENLLAAGLAVSACGAGSSRQREEQVKMASVRVADD
ncbi:RNA-guided endonuclease TnpB family protein [Streptomyces sp. NPDC059949]|uniref:RNA-guided endonuclease TnpB family protein n=1 Tax=Streptomyces sp. NPDC059949 TaxID=3347013 RepID=UPI00364A524C